MREASWLAGIGSPIRLHILCFLAEAPEASVAELLAGGVPGSPSAVRRHLRALVSMGLVREIPSLWAEGRAGRPAARFTVEAALTERVRALIE